MNDDKKAAYNTMYEVLAGVCLLAAPFCALLPEEIYRSLTGKVSVHLGDYPCCNEELLDEALEAKMDMVRSLVSMGRSAREDAQIKVSQPLLAIHVGGQYQEQIADLVPLIQEELNVHDVVFEKDLDEFMDYTLKPDF